MSRHEPDRKGRGGEGRKAREGSQLARPTPALECLAMDTTKSSLCKLALAPLRQGFSPHQTEFADPGGSKPGKDGCTEAQPDDCSTQESPPKTLLLAGGHTAGSRVINLLPTKGGDLFRG